MFSRHMQSSMSNNKLPQPIYNYEFTSASMKRRKQIKTRTAYLQGTKLTVSVMIHGRFSYSGCKLPLIEPEFMA